MKFKEIERKMQAISATSSAHLNSFHLLLLACYADNYSQKESIVIEDQIKGVNIGEMRNYGIFSSEATYTSSLYERVYILFIDNLDDVKDEESFDRFSTDYVEKFLPKGAVPSIYALKFNIESYDLLHECTRIIKSKYQKIIQLYSFPQLRKDNLLQARLTEKYAAVGETYNIFEFTKKVFEQRIISFMTDSSYRDENSITLFYDRLNDLAKTELKDKTLILNDCVENDEAMQDYLALALAYITFRFKIPVMADDLILNKYKRALHLFHCSFDIYTAGDKINFLKKYPKLCYSYQSMLDFLVYIPPEMRKLTATIEYMKDGKIKADEVDLMTTVAYSSIEEPDYEKDLIQLEEKCHEEKFLHVGNTLYMDIEGEKKLVHCLEWRPDYKSIVYACDKTLPPFICPLNLTQLIGMLPCGALKFHKDKTTGKSLVMGFMQKLGQLVKQGLIPMPSLNDGLNMYLPSYAESGLGPIIYEITRIRGDQFKFHGVDKNLLLLYGHYSVQMRKEVVDSIFKEVPRKNLRKIGNYLTIWGANSSLTLESNLFRTIREEE